MLLLEVELFGVRVMQLQIRSRLAGNSCVKLEHIFSMRIICDTMHINFVGDPKIFDYF